MVVKISKKEYTLRFRKVNSDIFIAIKNEKKKIETRAATKKYQNIKAGDTIMFVCAGSRFKKKVRKVEFFKSVGAILTKYRPKTINSNIHTTQEAYSMWYSFPGYKEKINKYGLVAIS